MHGGLLEGGSGGAGAGQVAGSKWVDADRLLLMLPGGQLLELRAILLGKLGQHLPALRSFPALLPPPLSSKPAPVPSTCSQSHMALPHALPETSSPVFGPGFDSMTALPKRRW